MAKSSSNKELDPQLEELKALASVKRMDLRVDLASYPYLLAVLPELLVDKTAFPFEKARILARVFEEVVAQAHRRAAKHHAQRGQNVPFDDSAHMTLAAGTFIGIITEPPGDYSRTPAQMDTARSQDMETRKLYAGQWLMPPINTRKGFDSWVIRCLNTFRHDVIDFLRNDERVGEFQKQIGVSGFFSANEKIMNLVGEEKGLSSGKNSSRRQPISELRRMLGKELRRLREDVGLTTRGLVATNGHRYSSGHIANVETGRIRPSSELIDTYVRGRIREGFRLDKCPNSK